MRIANYQAAMGEYHRQLWNKIPPFLQAILDASKSEALNVHAEATTLAKQQRIASHHTADAVSKAMATFIALRHHAWLRSSLYTIQHEGDLGRGSSHCS